MDFRKMEKELSRIRTRAAEVGEGSREKEAEAKVGLEQAREALRKAEAKRDSTIDTAEYEAADRAAKDAEHKEAFCQRLYEHTRYQPHMTDEEYDGYIEKCKGYAEAARDDFRKVARECMEKLQAARDEYVDTIDAINSTLTDLDSGANVLQCRHRKKYWSYAGDNKYVAREDVYEWGRHKTRFDAGSYFYRNDKKSDDLFYAAWRATKEG